MLCPDLHCGLRIGPKYLGITAPFLFHYGTSPASVCSRCGYWRSARRSASDVEVGESGMKIFASAIFAAVTMFSASALAAPVTIDFGLAPNAGGAIGTSSAAWSVGGLTATATCGSTAASCTLTQAPLTSLGIGVHSPGELFFGIPGTDIDSYELDGFNNDESIALTFGGAFTVALTSVVLELVDEDFFSLDTNAELRANGAFIGNGFVFDGIATGGLAICGGGIGGGGIGGGGGGMTCNVNLSMVAGLSNLTTLSLGAITGDDSFIWRSATFDISAVPIPGALPLFATGLAALGFAAHRRRRRKVAAATG